MSLRPRVLGDLLTSAADRAPDSTVSSGIDGKASYAELAGRVTRLANGLLALGLDPGDRLAIHLPKSIRAVEWLLAANLAGLVCVPINPVLRPRQLRHLLLDSRARALTTSAGGLALWAELLRDCPSLDYTVVNGPVDDSFAGRGLVDADSLYLDGRPIPVRSDERQTAVIFYTSGSTGLPKGVMVSNANLIQGAAAVVAVHGTDSDDRILALLPFSFDAGFSQMTIALSTGASLALLDHLLPADTLEFAARHETSHLTGVPPLFRQLASVHWPERLGETMRSFASTGGTMPPDLLRRLQALMPRARGYLMYGFTEAFRATILPPDDLASRPDSVGLPMPGAELYVLRPDGQPCEPGEAGELVQAGPLVAQGYWGDENATAARFRALPASADPLRRRAVWSGDVVCRDADGYVYFRYRDSQLIKTSGYRVSPEEVEAALLDSGLVDEALALGVPDPDLEEVIVALVVARDPGFSPADLQAWCRREMPPYLCPADIRPVREIPRSPNGKYDRQAIRNAILEEGGSV